MARFYVLIVALVFSTLAQAIERPSSWLVQLKVSPYQISLSQLAQQMGVQRLKPIHRSSLWVEAIGGGSLKSQALRRHPLVKSMQRNVVVRGQSLPNDPDFKRLWGFSNHGQSLERSKLVGVPGVDIGWLDAWKDWGPCQFGRCRSQKPVIVAISDSGMALNEKDLMAHRWVNEAEAKGKPQFDDDGNGFDDDIFGYNFDEDKASPEDKNGHGTHIAGIIGASGNNQLGIPGIAWNVQLMPIKWLDSGNFGSMANGIRSIHYAIDKGARIINCSWGEETPYKVEALIEAFERAGEKNVLIVVAAGNDSTDLKYYDFYPAKIEMDHVIKVAAIDNQGNLWGMDGYGSNYGRDYVDLAAPGEDIVSYTLQGLKPWSGTSMAAPFVSGVAALVLTKEPNLSAVELKARLLRTSKRLPSLRRYVRTSGLVNAYYALRDEVPPVDPEDVSLWPHQAYELMFRGYQPNEERLFEISVPGVKRFALYFEKFHFESHDFLEFIDSKGKSRGIWRGNHNDMYSPLIEGDHVTLRFQSDFSVQLGAMKITAVAVEM